MNPMDILVWAVCSLAAVIVAVVRWKDARKAQ